MLNIVNLQGRLAADPELHTTPTGVEVTSFRIGVTRDYNRNQTDWINIVAWRKTAEFICKYFSKGSMILLQGSIQSRSYKDKNGNNRTAHEIVADRVWFGEQKREKAVASAENQDEVPLPEEPDYDDIPDDYEDLGYGDFPG